MSKFVSEFKEFISRGNVVDMAVGIIMGSAFTAIVTSLVDDLIMPVIGMICAGVNIAELSVQVGSATLKYGAFLQAVLNFLIIALVIFSMVKAINSARAKAESLKKKKEEEAPKEEENPILRSFFSKKSATFLPKTKRLQNNSKKSKTYFVFCPTKLIHKKSHPRTGGFFHSCQKLHTVYCSVIRMSEIFIPPDEPQNRVNKISPVT